MEKIDWKGMYEGLKDEYGDELVATGTSIALNAANGKDTAAEQAKQSKEDLEKIKKIAGGIGAAVGGAVGTAICGPPCGAIFGALAGLGAAALVDLFAPFSTGIPFCDNSGGTQAMKLWCADVVKYYNENNTLQNIVPGMFDIIKCLRDKGVISGGAFSPDNVLSYNIYMYDKGERVSRERCKLQPTRFGWSVMYNDKVIEKLKAGDPAVIDCAKQYGEVFSYMMYSAMCIQQLYDLRKTCPESKDKNNDYWRRVDETGKTEDNCFSMDNGELNFDREFRQIANGKPSGGIASSGLTIKDIGKNYSTFAKEYPPVYKEGLTEINKYATDALNDAKKKTTDAVNKAQKDNTLWWILGGGGVLLLLGLIIYFATKKGTPKTA